MKSSLPEDKGLSLNKRIIFVVVPFLILLVALEAASYLYLHYRFKDFDLKVQGNSTMIENRYQVWEHPAKYTSWSGLTHFNNYGFKRFTDTTLEKADGTVRIVIMGGSTAFGSQDMPGSEYLKISGQGEYSTDETISAWLEKLLNEKYPGRKYEVINAAVNWTKLHQQMLNYLRKIRSFEPDLVISIDGLNDSSGKIKAPDLNAWDVVIRDYEDALASNLKYKLRPVFTNSHLSYLLAMVMFRTGTAVVDESLVDKYSKVERPAEYEQIISNYYEDNKNLVDRGVDEYVKGIKYFSSILDNDNVKYMFIFQPLAHLDTFKVLSEKEKAIQGYIFTRLEYQYYRDNFYKNVIELGNMLREKKGVNFWSFLDMYDGVEGDVYTDYCHLTPYGNKVFAQKLIDKIEAVYPELLVE